MAYPKIKAKLKPKLNIFEAASQGNLAVLNARIQEGVDPETTRDGEYGRNPLQWAVIGNQLPIVQALLAHNPAQIDHRDHNYQTALSLAVPGSPIFQHLMNYQQHLLAPLFSTYSTSVKNRCRWKTTRLQQFSFVEKDEKERETRHQYDTMHLCLTHHSRKHPDQLKWSFDIDQLHNELAANLNDLTIEQSGNKALASLTFEIKLFNNERTAITLPIKVPGFKTYTRTQAMHDVGSELKFLNLLKLYYETGRSIARMAPGAKHGHEPDYAIDASSSHQQYINHSEQALVAYLSTPYAANYFCTALRTAIRGQDIAPLGSEIKIYTIILHIHSTKTACGACEFVLTGLMNLTQASNPDITGLCMIEQYQQIFALENGYYRFTFPKKIKAGIAPGIIAQPGVRLFTTYSADRCDTTHPVDWHYTPLAYTDVQPTRLETCDRSESRFVYICRFRHGVKERQYEIDLDQYSCFFSASDGNSNTPKRLQNMRERQNESIADLTAVFDFLYNNYEIEEWTLDYDEVPMQIIHDFESGRLKHGSSLTINDIPLRLVTSVAGIKWYIEGKTKGGKRVYLIRRVRGG